MHAMVVGTGSQKSLQRLLKLIEEQLRRSQGLPRKLTIRADDAEIVAERPGFEGPFERFMLRLRVPEETAHTLRETSAKYANLVSCHEDDGWQVIHCPIENEPSTERSQEAIEKISAVAGLPEVWRVVGENYRIDRISVELLFQAMLQYKASDVHLAAGETPVFRVDGQTFHSEIMGRLSSVQILTLIKEIAPESYWQEFERDNQTSFSFHQIGLGYSRVSAFMKCGAPHCTLRFLPESIPSFEDLHVPRDTMVRLGALHHGLILITGMTGSGKTTTAAALVDYINSTKMEHILSIENPIEFVHTNKKCIVSQRNLGEDVATFNLAVTGALRHDPDVIFIGEMRDPDTIRSAINAAATGHLVISTLHSNTASEVVNRIVSFFDPIERDLVRLQLRDCVRCVICQRLVPRIGGGRMPALEFMFNDIKPISDGIIEGNTDAIRIGMQQTVGDSFLFEEYLLDLVKSGHIDLEHARAFSTDQSILDQMYMGTYSVPRLDSLKALRAGGA